MLRELGLKQHITCAFHLAGTRRRFKPIRVKDSLCHLSALTHILCVNYVSYLLVNLTLILTARVKISQNFDILPKVYLVHLKVEHCQTLRVVRTFTGQNESTVMSIVWYCSVWSK